MGKTQNEIIHIFAIYVQPLFKFQCLLQLQLALECFCAVYMQAVQILSEKLDRCDETQDLRSGLMSLDQPQSELGGWRTRLTDIYSVLEKLRPFFIPGAKLIHPPERFRRVVAHGWCRNAGTKRPRVWDEDEFPERGRGEIRDQRSEIKRGDQEGEIRTIASFKKRTTQGLGLGLRSCKGRNVICQDWFLQDLHFASASWLHFPVRIN